MSQDIWVPILTRDEMIALCRAMEGYQNYIQMRGEITLEELQTIKLLNDIVEQKFPNEDWFDMEEV